MKPLASSNAIARASPNAKFAVVEEVGARSSGQASFFVLITMFISELLAIEEDLLPVIATIL